MIVVSDTGPIQYLVLVGAINLLETFYSEVVIPNAVLLEINQPTTPASVREWVADLPTWVTVRQAEQVETLPYGLGRGETEAIALATELECPILLDDLDARRVAFAKSIPITGTLGILLRAHIEEIIDIDVSLSLLDETSFRMSPAVRKQVLERVGRG